jgi:hypothetical protein
LAGVNEQTLRFSPEQTRPSEPPPTEATGNREWQGKIAPAILLSFLIVACLAPFAGKALHIDDTLFVRVAGQIRKHPADFYGFSMNWYGRTKPMPENFDNPPLACYYLALASWLAGWNEFTLHTAMILPAVLAALGTYVLARHHCQRPFLAATAACLTPVFLISATTLMCDVMLLAFWVWSAALFERGLRERNRMHFLASGLAAALACATKFTGLALIPLLGVYGLVRMRRGGWWMAAPLLPLAWIAGYQWITRSLYGKGLVLTAAAVAAHTPTVREMDLLAKQMIGLCFLGGCFLPVLLFAPRLWSARGLGAVLGITLPILLVYPYLGQFALLWEADGTVNWPACILSAFFALSAVQILCLGVSDCWARRDESALLLLLWIIGVYFFATRVNWTTNGRSFLPMAPAVGILVARQLDRRAKISAARTQSTPALVSPISALRGRFLEIAPLLFGAALSLWLMRMDSDFASAARLAARDLCATYLNAGRQLWFQGHWGFQYYMEQGGARALESDFIEPRRGDIVVVPSEGVNQFDLGTNLVRLVATKEYGGTPCWSVMNSEVGAGFYAATAGPFPFALGRTHPNRFYVFEVIRELDLAPKTVEDLFKAGAVVEQLDLERQTSAGERLVRRKPMDIAARLKLAGLYRLQLLTSKAEQEESEAQRLKAESGASKPGS